jgi:hypothetical protein
MDLEVAVALALSPQLCEQLVVRLDAGIDEDEFVAERRGEDRAAQHQAK